MQWWPLNGAPPLLDLEHIARPSLVKPSDDEEFVGLRDATESVPRPRLHVQRIGRRPPSAARAASACLLIVMNSSWLA